MNAADIVLLAYVLLGCLYWAYRALAGLWLIRSVPQLADEDPPAPQDWPTVSVVVPARDEAEHIDSALASLLASDYARLQVVLVDDRSTDGTGEVMARVAAGDGRVRVVHVTDLPDGWLGKVHAMQRGLEACEGQYVLFTDADVHFQPDTLPRAVAYAVAHGIDHLAGLPELWRPNLLVGAMVSAFMPALNLGVRMWAVNDENSSAFMGVGAFNLVRREALDQTEGLAWLKMEVGDDAGLGCLMKSHGWRLRLVGMRGHVGLSWYDRLGDMVRGMEKGFASAAGCRFSVLLIQVLLLLAAEAAPFVGMATGAVALATRREGSAGWWVGLVSLIVGAAVWLFSVRAQRRAARWSGQPAAPVILAPLGMVLLMLAFVRAGWLGMVRGGVVWRGTVYPSAQLRAGRRIKPLTMWRSKAVASRRSRE